MHEYDDGDLRIAEIRVFSPSDLLRLAERRRRRYPSRLERRGDFFDPLDGPGRGAGRTGVAGLALVGGWLVYLSYEMAQCIVSGRAGVSQRGLGRHGRTTG